MAKPIISTVLRAVGGVIGRRVGRRPTNSEDLRLSDRRREPRYFIAEAASDDDRVVVMLPPSLTLYKVVDLASNGLSFTVNTPVHSFPLGERLEARICFGTTQFDVELELVNRRDNLVGCRIIDVNRKWTEEVGKLLDPRRIGEQLRQIDPAYAGRVDDPELELDWFQAGPTCDLFIWRRNSALDRVQVFATGALVEWCAKKGLRTGGVDIARVSEGSRGYAASTVYDLHTPPSLELVHLARRILDASDKVPAPVRNLFEGTF